jgi:putative FmdB family regulatory protein
MPTYEYKCRECGHKLEFFQSMNDAALKECPECKNDSLKRLIGTGAGIIFKGSGFYQTDYRSDSYHKSAKKETEAAASASSSSDKKSEKSVPADKPSQATNSKSD